MRANKASKNLTLDKLNRTVSLKITTFKNKIKIRFYLIFPMHTSQQKEQNKEKCRAAKRSKLRDFVFWETLEGSSPMLFRCMEMATFTFK